MNSPKQTRVLEILRENGGTATFQDFVNDPAINTHYANGGHYISELLTKMIRQKLITRVKKRGVFVEAENK
jgi:hypothetical protein